MGKSLALKKQGKFVETGEEQNYQVTVHAQKTFKGKHKKLYKFIGSRIYNDIDSDQFATGDCGSRY